MRPEAVIARALGVPPDRVSRETSNQNLEEWDSLGHITLLLELEAEYATSFSTEESLELTSVEAIHRALEARGIAW
jgi:acyl carrier protein